MYRKPVFVYCIFVLMITSLNAQSVKPAVKKTVDKSAAAKPKLVVGIVIDQMRWDYLHRFNTLFGLILPASLTLPTVVTVESSVQ